MMVNGLILFIQVGLLALLVLLAVRVISLASNEGHGSYRPALKQFRMAGCQQKADS